MENNNPQPSIAHDPDGKTTVQLRYKTTERLTSHKRGNDTYDDVINRTLDNWEKDHPSS